MEKYRGRRFLLSTFIMVTPQFFFNYVEGLFISIVLQWALLFIIWSDNNNRFWITRFFDPN